jgi:hypothetical protein
MLQRIRIDSRGMEIETQEGGEIVSSVLVSHRALHEIFCKNDHVGEFLNNVFGLPCMHHLYGVYEFPVQPAERRLKV